MGVKLTWTEANWLKVGMNYSPNSFGRFDDSAFLITGLFSFINDTFKFIMHSPK